MESNLDFVASTCGGGFLFCHLSASGLLNYEEGFAVIFRFVRVSEHQLMIVCFLYRHRIFELEPRRVNGSTSEDNEKKLQKSQFDVD
ncbi:hypothetical protein F2P81_022798 [Scophthalmus maximus]|uniref:Uncharacterized protein n=1 Tax=Scophthalmus maximus TaxID=52904 RepID=A0A6A4RZA0_SCOMX|nr:hypothetical protein F2P81_022798 [Scophthalmus maximus]